MKSALAAVLLVIPILLSSCGGGGRSVTVGGEDVPISFFTGELDRSVVSSVEPSVTAHPGDDVTAKFEFVPDTVAVACCPDGGEAFSVSGRPDGLSFTFAIPDVSGRCGFTVEYTIDGRVYNIVFALNVIE